MNPRAMWLIAVTLTATVVITLVGCSDGDSAARQELVDFAKQMVAEQQAASRSLQSQSAQLSAAAKELVASDAAARAELISAGSQLHAGIAQQRQELDRVRDELVSEQRAIARSRHCRCRRKRGLRCDIRTRACRLLAGDPCCTEFTGH